MSTPAAHTQTQALTATDYVSAMKLGVARLRFEAHVEAEFRHSHALRMRAQVRFWQTFQLITGLAGVAAILGGALPDRARVLMLACGGVHLAVSMALVSIAFNRAYLRIYLKLAVILTPFRAAAFAIVVAAFVDAGGSGTAAMTVNMFGLLFFSGLPLRQAVPAAVVMIGTFFGALTAFAVPAGLTAYSMTSLLVVFGLAGFVAWDMQSAARAAFLQYGLTRSDATRDALTSLVNRRHFDTCLETVWRECGDAGRPLTVLLVDVDHFKAFNDSYGHQAGDGVLRRVAHVLRREARERDVVARFGGEEFVLLATGLDALEAEALAEKLCHAVETLAIPHSGARSIGRVTISIGGACIVPLPDRSAAGALQMADENLYSAKRQGRNRVVFQSDEYSMLQTGQFRRPELVRGPG